MRPRWILGLGCFALVACGGGDDDGGGPPRLFLDPGEFRFGLVEVGASSTAVSTISNLEGGAFEIEKVEMRPLDQLTYEFSFSPKSVAADETARLEVTYHPVGKGDSAVQIVVTPRGGDPVVMDVNGTAISPAKLRLGDASIDFGTVPIGSSMETVSSITNRETTAGTVTFDPGLNVDLCDTEGSDRNTFCVKFTGVSVDSQGRFPIDASETINYAVRFVPQIEDIVETADFKLRTCAPEEAGCELTVELSGEGTN